MYTLVKVWLLCGIASWCAHGLPVWNNALQDASLQQGAGVVTIPDGAKLELRFTQPLRGPISDFPWTEDVAAAQPHDKVRLVAAQNLFMDNRLVIARGAIGQAT